MNRGFVAALALTLASACGGSDPQSGDDGPSLWSTGPSGIAVVTLMPRATTIGVEYRALSTITPATSGGITTSESGTTTAFTIVLGSVPTANVVVTPSSSNTAEATVSGALTFTAANWSTPQLVTITGIDDLIADGSQNFVVSATTASSDPNFNGISASLVNGTNLDNDTVSVKVITGGLSTGKDGTTASFNVVLTSKPLGTVTVATTSSDTTLGVVSASTLTFTTANWSTPQTLTITGQRNYFTDPSNAGTPYFVQVGPVTSSDTAYAAMPNQQLLVTNLDTDHELDKLVVIAGPTGGPGNLTGFTTAARFSDPTGVAIDSEGTVYVADGGNHTIRRIPTNGYVYTLVGSPGVSGAADGTGTNARFNNPMGVAVDSAGNLYVADNANYTVRKVTSQGVVTTLAGLATSPGTADGNGTVARFESPTGVAVDAAGNVYVADFGGNTIRKITAAGVVTTFAGQAFTSGSANGNGTAAQFSAPRGVAVDAAGNVYVADQSNATIRKITAAGVVTTLAGKAGVTGTTDGAGTNALFSVPTNLTVDAAGNVYVVDSSNQTIRKITAAGVVSTLAGGGPGVFGAADGIGTNARFYYPSGVTVDTAGSLYVSDSDNDAIRKVSTATGAVVTFAGAASVSGHVDATGTNAQFNLPYGVAVDASANIYVADVENSVVRKITPAGVTTTFAGSGVWGTTDATGTAAQFESPTYLVFDSSGNLFVTDVDDEAIRKITPAGVVTTFAGAANVTGTTDGTGAAARFFFPNGIGIDASNNLFVTDYENVTIRKITAAGVVSTYAGSPGMSGTTDGIGTAARFLLPIDVAADAAGNVYVSDDSTTIRKITTARVVTTFAGAAGTSGFADGAGTAARFSGPQGLAVDGTGNLYVCDANNNTIRKVTSAGVVSTVLGVAGLSGVSQKAIPATLRSPNGVAFFNNALVVSTADNSILVAMKSTAW